MVNSGDRLRASLTLDQDDELAAFEVATVHRLRRVDPSDEPIERVRQNLEALGDLS